jgi:hypothetical protein
MVAQEAVAAAARARTILEKYMVMVGVGWILIRNECKIFGSVANERLEDG